MSEVGASDVHRDLHPTLRVGARNTLDELIGVCAALRKGYSSTGGALDELVHAARDLQHVDRLLSVLLSSAGALNREPISRIGWALVLARSCLQSFLLRRFYDAGVELEAGVDPSVRVVVQTDVRSAMADIDVDQAHRTLSVLLEKLQHLHQLLTSRDELAGVASKGGTRIGEADVVGAFQELETSCRLTIRSLSQWITKSPSRPTLELGPLNDASRQELAFLLECFGELDLSKRRARLEGDLDELCRRIMDAFEYRHCGIQMIRAGNVIQTVAAGGLAAELVGLARHRIAWESELRDIQADIVLQRRVEVIRGADERFDQFLFLAYKHAGLVRAFVPIVIFRNEDGSIVTQPPHGCWTLTRDTADLDGRVILDLRTPDGQTASVIGTVEAGFKFTEQRPQIEASSAMALADLVTELAPAIYENTVEHAYELALQRVAQITGADSAALQLLDEATQEEPRPLYAYQPKNLLLRTQIDDPRSLTPLSDKPGHFLFPDPGAGETHHDLKRAYPALYKNGVKRMAAFPISFGRLEGLFSVYFASDGPSKSDLGAAALLVHRYGGMFSAAEDAQDARDRLRQSRAQADAFQRLQLPETSVDELEFGISWIALNVLAADIVTVQKYDEPAQKWDSSPIVAGRLISREAVRRKVTPDDVRWQVLKCDDAIWAEDAQGSHELMVTGRTQNLPRFVDREKLASVAALPLRVQEQNIGVMFISFRSGRTFSDDDKEFIRRFGRASAALMDSGPGGRAAAALALQVTTLQKIFDPSSSASASARVQGAILDTDDSGRVV